MRRTLALLALPLLLAGAGAGCGGSGGDGRAGEAQAAAPRPVPTPAPDPAAVSTPREAGDPAVKVVRRTALRARPGGRVVARAGPRTEFGSPRYLPVLRRRGPWLGVIAAERPNGRLAWIAAADTSPARSPVRIDVDLSDRELRVRRDRRTLLRMTVGVGSAAHPTPTGHFAVTDGLRGRAGSPYGCCILALSGHQPDVPQGWAGGDRLAVHGTGDAASVGRAVSLGCLRAHDDDLRRLLRLARLGAIVEISD